jgi:hypothetical protein
MLSKELVDLHSSNKFAQRNFGEAVKIESEAELVKGLSKKRRADDLDSSLAAGLQASALKASRKMPQQQQSFSSFSPSLTAAAQAAHPAIAQLVEPKEAGLAGQAQSRSLGKNEVQASSSSSSLVNAVRCFILPCACCQRIHCIQVGYTLQLLQALLVRHPNWATAFGGIGSMRLWAAALADTSWSSLDVPPSNCGQNGSNTVDVIINYTVHSPLPFAVQVRCFCLVVFLSAGCKRRH